ncbi:hypothetical protein V5O48_005193 [Marasmius crinis-equi]|uniref:Uncharacterized protein n=1 Tax=Marasmius crinis-equi TaxID=585013 RepID=A0ABR3FN80_9AGAR
MARFRRLAIINVELAPRVFDAFDNTVAFPRLESVYLLKGYPLSLDCPWLWEAVRRAPRLDKVFVQDTEWEIPYEVLTGWNMRLLELTCLSVSGQSLRERLLSILPTLRNLEFLTLRDFSEGPSWLDFSLVRCESLRGLKIIQSDSDTSRVILQNLDLPNLVSLDLTFHEQVDSFEGLFSPLSSFSSLRVLSLVFDRPPSDRIARILNKVPNLTVFAAGVHYHASSFDSLDPLPQLCAELAVRPTVCPKLRLLTLAVEEDRVTRSMLENIQNFIEGRGSTLSHVKLVTTPPRVPRAIQDEEVIAALQLVRTACHKFEHIILPCALFQRETPIEAHHSLLD